MAFPFMSAGLGSEMARHLLSLRQGRWVYFSVKGLSLRQSAVTMQLPYFSNHYAPFNMLYAEHVPI